MSSTRNCIRITENESDREKVWVLQVAALRPTEIAGVFMEMKRIIGDHMSNYKRRFKGTRSELNYFNAIPALWNGVFPCIYIIPTSMLQEEALFKTGSVISNTAAETLKGLLKRSRKQAGANSNAFEHDDARGASTSGAVHSSDDRRGNFQRISWPGNGKQ
jgi:hypothetical protein